MIHTFAFGAIVIFFRWLAEKDLFLRNSYLILIL